MSLSLLIEEYLETINVLNDKKKLYSIKKSLSLLIEICGDKPIDLYSINDANSFKNYFIKIDKISTGKRNQSNLQNFFSVIFQKYLIDKKNPFAGLKWPNIIVKVSHQKFSDEELIRTADDFDVLLFQTDDPKANLVRIGTWSEYGKFINSLLYMTS